MEAKEVRTNLAGYVAGKETAKEHGDADQSY